MTHIAISKICFFSVLLLLAVSAPAVDFVWDNSEGDNDFANPLNWVGDAFLASETAVVDLAGINKAVLGSGSPANIDVLRIGYNGSDGAFEQTGGTLTATSNPGAVSRVGNGSGKTGSWLMTGGTANINAIQLGLGSGTGDLTLAGGTMAIARGYNDYSLHVGAGGTGMIEIAGGSLNTRTGVIIGNGSTFKVTGSAAATIGIGSHGLLDGRWMQAAGGVLCVGIDTTPTGVSKIFVDEIDGTTGVSWDGNVTFEAGSLLDVGYLAATNPGTFTVMEWDGVVTNNGLAFAPSVDTNVWSFNVDALNKRLTVTAAGTAPGRTAVTVNSLAGLKLYLNATDHDVTMAPGTYRITPADVTSGLFPDSHLFEFIGSSNVYDFTGVTFEIETDVFQSFGGIDVKEIAVFGEGQVLKNLTLTDIGNTRPSKTALGVLLDGVGNRVEGFNVTVRGSQPYGYGDIFGKGSGYVIKHFKHSAILVRGEDNHLLNCKVFHRAYGHGIFCQGSINAVIEGCYVEGEVRSSDDVLAEAGSGSSADNVDFRTNWGEDENGENGYTLQPGWMFSCQEDGIRCYNTGVGLEGTNTVNTANIQVIDCTVNQMRSGVTIGFCNNTKYVENCVVLGVEGGYWVGTEGEIVECAGNAVYGKLLGNAYQTDRDSVVDLTVLDNTGRYGNTILAYTGGSRHDLTFRSRDAYVDPNLRIMIAGIRTGIREYVVNPTYNDFSTTDVELYNHTQYPVEMNTKSTGTSGRTDGSVVDYGTGNSLAQIPVTTAGGYGVVQTIQAEEFSTQSGASIQTRGDGIRHMGAANDGDWICFEDFFMGSGPNRFEAFVMGGAAAGSIELRLDGAAGTLIGTCPVAAGSGAWVAETITLNEPRGKRDLYLVFKGTAGALPGLDRFRFYVEFPGRKAAKGLVGHWKFDETAGTVASDSSGYGHHGTMANAAWVSGKKGGALDFGAGASTVSIPSNAFDSVQEEITIACWAFGDAAQPTADSLFYAVDGSTRVLNIHLPYSDSTVYWDAGNDGGYDRISTNAASADYEGSWAHWVFTKNSKTGNMRIYRNGEMWHHAAFLQKEMRGITAASIGSQIGGAANYKGMIDDVRLYDVELMEHEVTQLYGSYAYTDAGTPHSWLDAHALVTGGDYAAADAQDADSDGLLNGREYWAGTDPTNAASVFRITDAESVGNQLFFDWSAVTGKTYDVWFKTNLMETAWVLSDSGILGIEPECTSTVLTDHATGFIQVEVER
ncbi:Endo-1,4-beta-xylanase Z [Pontiella desulfatans]|uniref:Endo-1,4-beta-xylanase Z n=1 Tax=Pontiella desulfatans TaxID=2750659 RepID=A0A6C2TWU0_PONDE|nr:carbohydrate-binding protein [Pontiella desulfatans]VGO11781.1 Endo-1,4-beta-xylanase Z [Pontiella desulfatans]